MANRYSHAKQMKRKRKMLKQLKTLMGWVYRDIDRQLGTQSDAVKAAFTSWNKIHKKYGFGVKVGITVTNKSNFVLGARSFPGNPYDGHTLESCLEQAEILSGTRAKEAFVDLGYRGVEVPAGTIYKARQKRGVDTRRLKRALKRRNAIEPVIGHLKNDGLLGRNYLKGEMGDALHAILCGAGHNIRLILRRLRIF